MLTIHHITPNSTINAQDRALFYGDGLFSTLVVQQSQALAWQYHRDRLWHDSQRLGFPNWDSQALTRAIDKAAQQLQQGIIKCIISRGTGGRGYLAPEPAHLQIYIYQYALPEYPDYSDGIQVRLCNTQLAQQPLLAGIKHLNRLEQVLARQEWQNPQIAEGLLTDTAGFIIEGTMSNVFFIKENVLYTPDLSQSGVAGIIRGHIIDLAQQWSIPVHINNYRLEDLIHAQTVFICNSVIGVWFVAQLLDENQQPLQQWSTHPLLQRFKSALLLQQWILS